MNTYNDYNDLILFSNLKYHYQKNKGYISITCRKRLNKYFNLNIDIDYNYYLNKIELLQCMKLLAKKMNIHYRISRSELNYMIDSYNWIK